MKRILIALTGALVWLCVTPASAQRAALLDSIAAHNTTLRALEAEARAQQSLATAENRLPDPELELAYMVGTPDGVPNRTNVNFSQTLDWGVLTGRRRALAQSQISGATAGLAAQRQTILAEASRLLTQAVYSNRLCNELTERLNLATEVARLYQQRYDRGDANALELNKVRLNQGVAEAELRRAEADRRSVLADLQRLNGGEPLACADTAYAEAPLPALADLLQRLDASHPQLTAARQAVEQSRLQTRLQQAMGWPAFTVGFTGEYIRQNNYSGLSLGVTLPLWGNSRALVKQSRAETLARQLDLADARQQLAAEVTQQYALANDLGRTAEQLRAGLAAADNAPLLRRSLEEGQISLLDYLLELSFYYTARTAWLDAERDARLAEARLRSYLY